MIPFKGYNFFPQASALSMNSMVSDMYSMNKSTVALSGANRAHFSPCIAFYKV